MVMPGAPKIFTPESMRLPLRVMVPIMTYMVFLDMPVLLHGLILPNTLFQIIQSRLMVSDAFRSAVGLPSVAELKATRELVAAQAALGTSIPTASLREVVVEATRVAGAEETKKVREVRGERGEEQVRSEGRKERGDGGRERADR